MYKLPTPLLISFSVIALHAAPLPVTIVEQPITDIITKKESQSSKFTRCAHSTCNTLCCPALTCIGFCSVLCCWAIPLRFGSEG